ncbi:hypothetical protein D9M68_839900 [compost metagenome]
MVFTAPADQLVQPPGIAGARLAGERAAERDDVAHLRRRTARHLARKDAAQAPTDQTHLAPVARMQFGQPLLHLVLDPWTRTEVVAQLPAVRAIAPAFEERAQLACRRVTGRQARQHQHRVAITSRCEAHQRSHREKSRELRNRPHFAR